MINPNFYITEMPKTRKADYCLGCFDGAVFIDLNKDDFRNIYLKRISFDGYGCCEIKEIKPLNNTESINFTCELKQSILNQHIILKYITKLIFLNKEHIWLEALNEYHFH